MNANKFGGLLLAITLTSPLAFAQTSAPTAPAAGTAATSTLQVVEENIVAAPNKAKAEANLYSPGLYGLREILLQYPVFVDPRASTECGLGREALLTVMQRNLQDPNLEVMLLTETHARRAARADITYEVYTTKIDQGCISLVNMMLTDRASLILAPVTTPRALTITYWQKIQLARSNVERHQTSVGDALAALSRSFLRDLKLAEPATYSKESAKPVMSEEDERNEKQQQMLRSINDSVSRHLINQGAGADLPSMGGSPAPMPDAQ